MTNDGIAATNVRFFLHHLHQLGFKILYITTALLKFNRLVTWTWAGRDRDSNARVSSYPGHSTPGPPVGRCRSTCSDASAIRKRCTKAVQNERSKEAGCDS